MNMRPLSDHKVLNNPALFRHYMKSIPTVNLSVCEYNKHGKFLKLASEYFGMPGEFFVESHHTGKTVRFVEIGPHDLLYNEDGWDGEQKIYRPVGVVPNVEYMVIYHAW